MIDVVTVEKSLKQIVAEYFLKAERERALTVQLDPTTDLYNYHDNTLIVQVKLTDEEGYSMLKMYDLHVLASLNGEVKFRETYKADLFTMEKMCDNFKNSFPLLMEADYNEARPIIYS